jgi:hypothetical protein
MKTLLGDPIRVAAIFGRGQMQPVWFDWKGRQVRVRETAFIWTTREGSVEIVHYSVTDGVNLYELSFDRGSMQWSLTFTEAA